MIRLGTNGKGLFALAALAAGAVLACDSPDPGTTNGDAAALFSCETEARAVPYEPNLTYTSKSGAWQAVLVASDPGPPIKGTNTWTVKIVDGAGVAQDGLTMTAAPYMPDHAHPSTIKATVTPQGGGVYLVKPLYLYMPGYWEITFALTPPGGPKDSVIFPICIPG